MYLKVVSDSPVIVIIITFQLRNNRDVVSQRNGRQQISSL
jgi:hypothetical protein